MPSCPSWSPHGRLMPLMVASWSPHAPHGRLMPLMVASWSPHGRLMVTSWSPRGRLVPLVVASCHSWSPRGRLVPLMVTSWPPWVSVGGDLTANASAVRPVQTRGLRLVVTYMETPRPLIGFFEAYAGPIWGDSGEVTRIYTSRDI